MMNESMNPTWAIVMFLLIVSHVMLSALNLLDLRNQRVVYCHRSRVHSLDNCSHVADLLIDPRERWMKLRYIHTYIHTFK